MLGSKKRVMFHRVDVQSWTKKPLTGFAEKCLESNEMGNAELIEERILNFKTTINSGKTVHVRVEFAMYGSYPLG